MRRAVLLVTLALAVPVAAQQAAEQPGFFDRLFRTDTADSDAEQGSLLERLIEDSLSGAGRRVVIEGFEGALTGRATLDSLTISDGEGVWLTLEDAVLDWNRAALFSGRLEVAELTADRIELPRLPKADGTEPPTPEASGFALPDLPVSVEIGRIAAGEVEIGAPVFGAEARVTLDGAVSLVDGEGDANLTIERLDGDGALTLSAAYANADQVLDLDLSLEEAEDGIFANLAELPGRPSVALSVTGNAPITDFSADIRLATDGAERLAGQVTLSQADDGARRIAARISGDIAPVFAPEYRPFFGDAIDLNTEAVIAPDGQILVPRLALSTEAISLSGALEFGANRLPRLVTLKGEIASEDGAPVLLPIGGAETRISRADLALFFDAGQSEDWTGNIRLTDLDRAGLAAERLALLGRGRIASGAAPEVIATLRFDARALDTGSRGLTDALGPDVNGEARITWQGGPVLFESLQVNAKALTASGNAEIAVVEEGPEVLGTLRLDARRLADFTTLAGRDLGGAADLNTTFRTLPLAGAFDIRASGSATDLTIGEPRADAILAGRAELGLQVSRDADGIHIQLDRLATDTADVTARADLRSGGSDVSLEAALKDTVLLLPALQGPSRITLTGREDTARDWAVTANLAGPGFGAGIDGRLSDIYDLPEFDGTVTAQADDLSAFADLAGRPLRGQLAIEAEGRVNGDLSRVALSAVANGRDVAIGQAETDRLLAGELSATIDAERSEDVVEVAEFDLSTALLDLEAAGQLAKRDSQLTVNARLADLAPFAAGFSGPLSVTGTIGKGDQTSLSLDLDATGPGGARASLTGSVEPDLSQADLSATGAAPLGLANRFIQPRSLAGTAGFDLRIAGPLTLQNLTGRITTTETRLAAPELGVALGGISGNVALAGGEAVVTLQGNVDGGGRLAVSGPVGLSSPNQAQLQINLGRVRLSDPRLYETSVDGQIRINGPLAGGAAITGALALGQTDIRIPDSGFGGAADVPEIIHLNEPPPVRSTRRRAGLLDGKSGAGRGTRGPVYTLDIRVDAPNRIFVRGRGLDSEFGGGLRLAGTTADIIPLGGFELIRGRLDILGRRLQLNEARITMQGSFIPYIRLRASTDAEEYRVNVDVVGPIDNPEITFTSSPDLPQEEVLSRLIFGRGLETLSPFQAARLALAVRTLAGQGGEGVVGRIRNQTGLADLDITTGDDGNAAVRAGTYLGENIYTDVTVDSAGETELNLNLDITPSLTARGGVSNTGDSSVGIFFERDY